MSLKSKQTKKKTAKLYAVKMTKIQVEDLITILDNRVEAVDSNLKKEYDLMRRKTLEMIKDFSLMTIITLREAIKPKEKIIVN